MTSRTFEKAWRARARYRRDLAGFSTWLFTIAKNVRIDYLDGRRSHLPIDAALNAAAEGTPEQEAERGVQPGEAGCVDREPPSCIAWSGRCGRNGDEQ